MWVPKARRGDNGVSQLSLRSNPYVSSIFYSTCFWAGDTFAPKLTVKNPAGEEVSIQPFLQNAFLDMWEMVAKTLGDLEGVLGFEVCLFLPHAVLQLMLEKIMNEPHRGYIDLQSMHAFDYNTDLHLGAVRECAIPNMLTICQ
jgi:hypothetical protein